MLIDVFNQPEEKDDYIRQGSVGLLFLRPADWWLRSVPPMEKISKNKDAVKILDMERKQNE